MGTTADCEDVMPLRPDRRLAGVAVAVAVLGALVATHVVQRPSAASFADFTVVDAALGAALAGAAAARRHRGADRRAALLLAAACAVAAVVAGLRAFDAALRHHGVASDLGSSRPAGAAGLLVPALILLALLLRPPRLRVVPLVGGLIALGVTDVVRLMQPGQVPAGLLDAGFVAGFLLLALAARRPSPAIWPPGPSVGRVDSWRAAWPHVHGHASGSLSISDRGGAAGPTWPGA